MQHRPGLDEIVAELTRRGIDDSISSLVLRYAANHAVEICNEATTELPLAASHDAYAAVYVVKTSLALALDPDEARKHQGFRLDERTAATTYLRVSAEQLRDQAVVAVIEPLIDIAFERSFNGPRWTRGLADRTLQRGDVCPRCYVEMPLSGVCSNCG